MFESVFANSAIYLTDAVRALMNNFNTLNIQNHSVGHEFFNILQCRGSCLQTEQLKHEGMDV